MLYEKRCSQKFTKFTGKHLCQSLFFNEVASLRPATLSKKTLAQVFSCEVCEIFKNTFFTDTFGRLLLNLNSRHVNQTNLSNNNNNNNNITRKIWISQQSWLVFYGKLLVARHYCYGVAVMCLFYRDLLDLDFLYDKNWSNTRNPLKYIFNQNMRAFIK